MTATSLCLLERLRRVSPSSFSSLLGCLGRRESKGSLSGLSCLVLSNTNIPWAQRSKRTAPGAALGNTCPQQSSSRLAHVHGALPCVFSRLAVFPRRSGQSPPAAEHNTGVVLRHIDVQIMSATLGADAAAVPHVAMVAVVPRRGVVGGAFREAAESVGGAHHPAPDLLGGRRSAATAFVRVDRCGKGGRWSASRMQTPPLIVGPRSPSRGAGVEDPASPLSRAISRQRGHRSWNEGPLR